MGTVIDFVETSVPPGKIILQFSMHFYQNFLFDDASGNTRLVGDDHRQETSCIDLFYRFKTCLLYTSDAADE